MTDKYPTATWVPADKSNFRQAGRTSFDLIVVHITDGRSRAEPVVEMWQTPHHGSSAHFVVDQDGSIIQAVALSDVAWHAHARNGESVGIEHCARSPGSLEPSDPGLPLSASQYASSAQLVAWLCRVGGFEPSRVTIMGHAEADSQTTHADCPTGVSGGWDWGRYMALVEAAYYDDEDCV